MKLRKFTVGLAILMTISAMSVSVFAKTPFYNENGTLGGYEYDESEINVEALRALVNGENVSDTDTIELIGADEEYYGLNGDVKVSAADGKIKLRLGDKKVKYSEAVPQERRYEPFIDEFGRTQVPVYLAANLFGANMSWNRNDNTLEAERNGILLRCTVGIHKIEVNDQEYEMDTCPVIVDGVMYLPVRYAAEAFGMRVKWLS